jgi:hypothetical protein
MTSNYDANLQMYVIGGLNLCKNHGHEACQLGMVPFDAMRQVEHNSLSVVV